MNPRHYTKHDLQNGALDLRYNTKAELDAGALDDRYYTETEVAAILAFYASLYDATQSIVAGTLGLGSPTGAFRLEVHDDDATYLAKIRNVRGDSSGNGLWVDTRWNVAANIPFRVTSNQGNAELLQVNGIGSVGIGGSSYGSGNLVVFLANALTLPTTNPTGGGVLYSDSGSLKWRGPGGTTTTLAHSNEEWAGVPFATGWGHYGSYFTNGTYRKVGDTVTLRGLVTRSSGSSMVICTLPVGYRPSGGEVFSQRTSVGDLRVDVTNNGNVTIAGGSFAGTWVSLSGISFSTT